MEFHSRGKINAPLRRGQHKKYFSSAKKNKEFPSIWFLPTRWQMLCTIVESYKCIQTLLGGNWPPYSLQATTGQILDKTSIISDWMRLANSFVFHFQIISFRWTLSTLRYQIWILHAYTFTSWIRDFWGGPQNLEH